MGMRDILINIAVAIGAPIIMGVCRKIKDWGATKHFMNAAGFSLNGIWGSIHKNYNNVEIVEIMRIKQYQKDRLKIIIQQYRNDKSGCYLYKGEGIVRSDVIALYYFLVGGKQNGVMALQVQDINVVDFYLEGTYYEISKERIKQNIGYYERDCYKLFKVKQEKCGLSKKPIYVNFSEAKRAVSTALEKR